MLIIAVITGAGVVGKVETGAVTMMDGMDEAGVTVIMTVTNHQASF
jgi:hypothetical protein